MVMPWISTPLVWFRFFILMGVKFLLRIVLKLLLGLPMDLRMSGLNIAQIMVAPGTLSLRAHLLLWGNLPGRSPL